MAREALKRSFSLLQCHRVHSGNLCIMSVRYYRNLLAEVYGVAPDKTRERVRIRDPELNYYKKHHYEKVIDADLEEEQDDRPPGRDPANAQRDRDFRARRKIMDAERGREPCLLTWSAKEQIRYLHRLNPEEFSAERLSESFPISLNDVRRLLRNRYSPVASSSLIARHDRTVAARWAALQTGRDWRKWVSEDQRRRYSDGSLIKAHFYGNSAFPSSPPTPEFKPPEPVQGPFTALLKTYIRMQEDKRKADELEKQPAVHALSDANPGNSLEVLEKRGLSRISSQPEMEEYRPFQPRPPRPAPLLGGIEFVKIEENEERDPEDTEVRIRRRGSRRKYGSVQLDEIKEDIITNHAKQQPESVQAYRKWFEQHKTEPVNAAKRQERSKEVVQEFEEYGQMVRKYKSSGGRNMLEETDDKIIIPQDKKKVGAIYKYGDSFYDEDGEFMYRVPI